MEPKTRKKTVVWAVLWAIPTVALGLYLYFSSEKQLAGRAVSAFSLPVRRALGACSALFPFSLMEVVYTLLGVLLIAYIAVTAIHLVKRPGKAKLLLGRAAVLGLAGLYAACGLLWLWNLDYHAPSFSEKEGYYAEAVSIDELYTAADFFIESGLARAETVPRDEDGLCAIDAESCFAASRQVYDRLEERFPSLAVPVQKPKAMRLYSVVMSRMGFTGVYFCFTGESNVNVDQPSAFLPFTAAHELAHQKGVAPEQECNFLGIAAGLTSGMPEFEYSACLAGTIQLMNALYKASPEKWEQLQQKITGPMLADLENNNEYWRARESKVTEASEQVYDAYLKANGQPLGIRSYGACVDLLVKFCLEG